MQKEINDIAKEAVALNVCGSSDDAQAKEGIQAVFGTTTKQFLESFDQTICKGNAAVAQKKAEMVDLAKVIAEGIARMADASQILQDEAAKANAAAAAEAQAAATASQTAQEKAKGVEAATSTLALAPFPSPLPTDRCSRWPQSQENRGRRSSRGTGKSPRADGKSKSRSPIPES